MERNRSPFPEGKFGSLTEGSDSLCQVSKQLCVGPASWHPQWPASDAKEGQRMALFLAADFSFVILRPNSPDPTS